MPGALLTHFPYCRIGTLAGVSKLRRSGRRLPAVPAMTQSVAHAIAQNKQTNAPTDQHGRASSGQKRTYAALRYRRSSPSWTSSMNTTAWNGCADDGRCWRGAFMSAKTLCGHWRAGQGGAEKAQSGRLLPAFVACARCAATSCSGI
jgi:hypothetical protein